jgi:hypothetical protein
LKLIGYLGKQGNGKEDREEYSETGHGLVIAKVQRGQKVEETLNKFKGIRLVSRNMGGQREWEGRWVGGE